jgi:hypothetical protein
MTARPQHEDRNLLPAQPDGRNPVFLPQHEDRNLLLLALGLLVASVAAGAAIGASRLDLIVPVASPGSLRDAAVILINNLEVWGLLVGATLLQPCGVPGLVSGFLPRWMTDMTVALVVGLNLVALGGAVGALGLHALVRVMPHAPFELGGYFIVVVAYLRARRGQLTRAEAIRRFAIAVVLLACGAVLESYVSGALL